MNHDGPAVLGALYRGPKGHCEWGSCTVSFGLNIGALPIIGVVVFLFCFFFGGGGRGGILYYNYKPQH